MNSIGKMQMHHTSQVASIREHNVSVRDSGIELWPQQSNRYWATDRIPEICIWNICSTQIYLLTVKYPPPLRMSHLEESQIYHEGEL